MYNEKKKKKKTPLVTSLGPLHYRDRYWYSVSIHLDSYKSCTQPFWTTLTDHVSHSLLFSSLLVLLTPDIDSNPLPTENHL